MIQIRSPKDCCGCTACAEICGHGAISMIPDAYGFPYPILDQSKCVDCGMCDKVCPILNNLRPRYPLVSYAFMHKDQSIRKKSSTAGAFVALSEKILSKGGMVFGCAFDTDWSAKHIYVENKDELAQLVGSKYLQSRIEGSFKDCRSFLRKGRYVLFSGTPCQIAGLKNYLGKDYDTLLCVDLICHGVPAPRIWQKYLRYREQKKSHEVGRKLFVNSVNFRDKSKGWTAYSLSLSLSDKSGHIYKEPSLCWNEDPYMLSFLRHLNMRPSCFQCRFRNQRSGSDITIGDYWGFSEVHPEAVDDKIGINALMVNTEKGRTFLDGIDFDGFESSYEKISYVNIQLVRSHWPHINLGKFLKKVETTDDFGDLLTDCLRLSLFKRLLSKARTFYMIYLKHLLYFL